MTETEYNNIQERLRLKLKERKPTGMTGKRGEGYEDGILSAMSIIKECHKHFRAEQELDDVINNAKHLFTMHPTPWKICNNGCDGYIADANGKKVFGGETAEAFIAEDNERIVALVDVINSIGVYMKGAN